MAHGIGDAHVRSQLRVLFRVALHHRVPLRRDVEVVLDLESGPGRFVQARACRLGRNEQDEGTVRRESSYGRIERSPP